MKLKPNEPILIEHAENGGLIVSQRNSENRTFSTTSLGAFTTPQDMISALLIALERLRGQATRE